MDKWSAADQLRACQLDVWKEPDGYRVELIERSST
jgi:hypothetical protein